MATYPLQFPAQTIASETLKLPRNQAVMESPHTFAQQVINKADHWTLEFAWPRMTHAEAVRVQAFIDALNGQVGSFYYSPRQPRASALTGKSLALSASSYSTLVSIGGWAASGASDLYVGQHVQIGQRLHRITSAPTNADGSGRCTVEVAPQVRTNQAAGTACEFVNPRGIFRLATSDGYAFTIDPDRLPSFPVILAKEAL